MFFKPPMTKVVVDCVGKALEACFTTRTLMVLIQEAFFFWRYPICGYVWLHIFDLSINDP
jgi:hypothetical protein